MKIESVRIQNLRAFKDATIPFNDYTCLIGPNGAGKSTVLCALNIFFRENQGSPNNLLNLSKEDFHGKDASEPIRVSVTFRDLNQAEQLALSHYFRNGKLIVTAEAQWNDGAGMAEVKQYGERMTFRRFEPIFSLYSKGAKAAEIKEAYSAIAKEITELPKPGTMTQMQEALHEYQSKHPEECEPAQSGDKFYGFVGTSILAPFIQWIFVPAVKDAATENVEAKNTALGKILARTVRAKISFEKETEDLRARTQEEYAALLKKNEGALKDISGSLQKRLQEWSHPEATLDLAWRNDPKSAVQLADPLAEIIAGEGEFFKGNLTRFGHGLQRCYLLALLQELAASDDSNSPKLLLGCEEPELYQHPPQARHLAGVFERLSAQNSQIVVCTHSPHFVSGKSFENVRLIRKCPKKQNASCAHVSAAEIEKRVSAAYGDNPPTAPQGVLTKIHAALQTDLNEMFFTPILILVEGIEDRAHITAYLHLLNLWDEFRRFGCHIVPANGKSKMPRPVAIARALNIPTFAVFDADSDCKPEKLTAHTQDNKAILTLLGYGAEDPMPKATVLKPDLAIWPKQIGPAAFDGIPAAKVHEIKDKVRAAYGSIGGIEKEELFVADVLVEAWNAGMKSAALTKLCESILAFAKAQRAKAL